jgi:hypothetical protein
MGADMTKDFRKQRDDKESQLDSASAYHPWSPGWPAPPFAESNSDYGQTMGGHNGCCDEGQESNKKQEYPKDVSDYTPENIHMAFPLYPLANTAIRSNSPKLPDSSEELQVFSIICWGFYRHEQAEWRIRV